MSSVRLLALDAPLLWANFSHLVGGLGLGICTEAAPTPEWRVTNY